MFNLRQKNPSLEQMQHYIYRIVFELVSQARKPEIYRIGTVASVPSGTVSGFLQWDCVVTYCKKHEAVSTLNIIDQNIRKNSPNVIKLFSL